MCGIRKRWKQNTELTELFDRSQGRNISRSHQCCLQGGLFRWWFDGVDSFLRCSVWLHLIEGFFFFFFLLLLLLLLPLRKSNCSKSWVGLWCFLLRRCLGWHCQTLVCPHWRVYQNLLWPQRRGRFGCLCQRWFDSDGVCRPHCKGPFQNKFLDVKIFAILHRFSIVYQDFLCVATKLCHRCGTCKPPSAFKHSADLEADIRRRMWSDWSWGHWWWLYVCVAKHLWMISFLTASHFTSQYVCVDCRQVKWWLLSSAQRRKIWRSPHYRKALQSFGFLDGYILAHFNYAF